eukprot:TRINITY_DN9741_c0_g1_i1.p2 TRINITY_DN9741_c0_g1~~TRINITY_DN9741_c0_g1_i1.p2  ORF type:complete len:313 (+),score=85.87 TRINITY_DN9741_c0_g1_i1:94-1032(+)
MGCGSSAPGGGSHSAPRTARGHPAERSPAGAGGPARKKKQEAKLDPIVPEARPPSAAPKKRKAAKGKKPASKKSKGKKKKSEDKTEAAEQNGTSGPLPTPAELAEPAGPDAPATPLNGSAPPSPGPGGSDDPQSPKRKFHDDASVAQDEDKGSRASGSNASTKKKRTKADRKQFETGLSGQKLTKVEDWMDQIQWNDLQDPDVQIAREQAQEEKEAAERRKEPARDAEAATQRMKRASARPSLCGATLRSFVEPGDNRTDSLANTSLKLRSHTPSQHSTISLTPSAVEMAQAAARDRGPRRSQLDIDKLLKE